MKRFKVNLFVYVVAAVLVPLLLAPAVAVAQAAPWTVVKSPNPGAGNGLFGAASISANDVWAVGDSSTSGVEQTLTLHWNGHTWRAVKSANVPSEQNELLAVAAVSPTDVWAVGDSNTSGVEQALIEHWNGTSWSIVSSPSPGGSNDLRGVAIISATDIWAVGAFFNTTSNVTQTLIEQWNGTSWSVVTSPNPSSTTNLLEAAAADKSSGQAWAVGEFSTPTMIDTLTEFNP